MAFALYNWSLVGLFAVFGPGPLWLQQIYLTVISSLMAFALTGLEEYTTWILLGLLAVWDLVAVLCPFGPLRLLIESSQTQQREVPALLYSVNAVWFMLASSEHMRLSRNLTEDNDGRMRTITQASLQTLSSTEFEGSTSSRTPLHPTVHQPDTQEEGRAVHRRSEATPTVDGFMRLRNSSESVTNADQVPARETSNTATGNVRPEPDNQEGGRTLSTQEVDEEAAEREGLKLGLGDFVFYSVLIARAALYDWITTVCCTIAVLTGLTATIFLLAIYKKALPALPISIAFGILFYFVAKAVLVPYIGALCVFGMVGL
ncbi:Presenilin-domain-containing protein [Syncephalastrum racemosum]|uniref:Presenilin-domain-containing protein n=1 Tax=Syncephalastrum racemosum TaxID=13706 RepID=A0A1X2HUG6_SYNRA|nr:Presenilin-domain-containing protein [Syncephalastrum racemosum]